MLTSIPDNMFVEESMDKKPYNTVTYEKIAESQLNAYLGVKIKRGLPLCAFALIFVHDREGEERNIIEAIFTSTFRFVPCIRSVHILRISDRRSSATGFPTGRVQ